MVITNKDSRLEALPQSILGDIISRVGQTSRTQLRNVMEAAPKLAKAAQDHRVYKKLNLRPLAIRPLAAIRRYQPLMEKCLANDNVEAHYIKGIQEYFHNNNAIKGLQHLYKAASGSYDDGIYLYGIIMLCRGENEVGKTYLDKIGWKQNKSKGDQCWRNIKRSIHGIRVMRLPCYMETLRATEETIMCNRNELEQRCAHCYYYKQMVKFVFII